MWGGLQYEINRSKQIKKQKRNLWEICHTGSKPYDYYYSQRDKGKQWIHTRRPDVIKKKKKKEREERYSGNKNKFLKYKIYSRNRNSIYWLEKLN